MSDNQREHEQKIAKIEARKAAFIQSPIWFTIWDSVTSIIEAVCICGVVALLAQCSCKGCIW